MNSEPNSQTPRAVPPASISTELSCNQGPKLEMKQIDKLGHVFFISEMIAFFSRAEEWELCYIWMQTETWDEKFVYVIKKHISHCRDQEFFLLYFR